MKSFSCIYLVNFAPCSSVFFFSLSPIYAQYNLSLTPENMFPGVRESVHWEQMG